MCNLFGENSCTWALILVVLLLVFNNNGCERSGGNCGCGCGCN